MISLLVSFLYTSLPSEVRTMKCNKCPACKTPLFARTKLPTLEAQGKARKAAVS